MKKEKIAAILLASVMVFGLCACTSADSANNSSTATVSADDEVTENSEDKTAAPEDSSASAESTDSDIDSAEADTNQSPDYVPLNQVIYDQDGITVTADGYDKNEYGKYQLALTVQNNTDATLAFDFVGFKINGIRVGDFSGYIESNFEGFVTQCAENGSSVSDAFAYMYPYHQWMVSDGESKQLTVSMGINDTTKAYFENIQTIDFSMPFIKMTDMESWDTFTYEMLPSSEISIQTEDFTGELQQPEITGTDIYNNNGIRVVMLDLSYEDSYLQWNCYIENTSDVTRAMNAYTIFVNDTSYSAYNYIIIQSNEAALATMTCQIYDIDSIEDITSLNYTIWIYADTNTEKFDILDHADFSYTP